MCGLWLCQSAAHAMAAANQCEAAFELSQSIDMAMRFNGVEQHQKVNVAYTLYVRSVPVPKEFKKKTNDSGLVAYLFLVNSPLVEEKSNGKLSGDSVDKTSAYGEEVNVNDHRRNQQPYPHPFLVVADSTGAMLTLQSTSVDIAVLKAYRSFYDVFQFSWLENSYQYLNGIGRYDASVVALKQNSTSPYSNAVIRRNKGYIETDTALSVQLLESEMRFYQYETQDCFFDKAEGVDVFSQTLNADTYVDIDSTIGLKKHSKQTKPLPAYFLSLTSDVDQWPGFGIVEQLSSQEIERRAPLLLLRLSSLVDDKEAFFLRLKEDVHLLPYLHEYLQENMLENEVSKKLYWALDRLNTVESVALLVNQSIYANSERDRYRSALALSSTNAPLSNEQINALKDHVLAGSTNTGYTKNHLVYVRLFGVIAKNRYQFHPEQSQSLRDYLYSQIGMNNTELNKAVIDAVGNLGQAIDDEGYGLLFSEAQYGSQSMRVSAVDALGRLNLTKELWANVKQAYHEEKALPVRQRWLALMKTAYDADLEVKLLLLNALNDDNLKVTALNSLDSVDFELNGEDILLLKAHLKENQNPTVQKQLASLIMRAKRREF
jgi:hypothetical protein